jgi:hypothetical protein
MKFNIKKIIISHNISFVKIIFVGPKNQINTKNSKIIVSKA